MRSVEVLTELEHAWPMASKCLITLRKVAKPYGKEQTKPLEAIQSQERLLSTVDGLSRARSIAQDDAAELSDELHGDPLSKGRTDRLPVLPETNKNVQLMDAAHMQQHTVADLNFTTSQDILWPTADGLAPFWNENFETSLQDFLQEQPNLGMMESW